VTASKNIEILAYTLVDLLRPGGLMLW